MNTKQTTDTDKQLLLLISILHLNDYLHNRMKKDRSLFLRPLILSSYILYGQPLKIVHVQKFLE